MAFFGSSLDLCCIRVVHYVLHGFYASVAVQFETNTSFCSGLNFDFFMA